jgi:macrodomain Ter protein organizer (MatP/YcbG family)
VTSRTKSIKVDYEVFLRLNEQRDFFGTTQSTVIDEALAANLVVKGVTYDDMWKRKLAILSGTDSK